MEQCSNSFIKELGVSFKQDNLSYSKRGVFRGLHYQWDIPMGKLISVISGSIIDYVVDIRMGSKSFGQYTSFNLNSDDGNILWIPPGFAHGFEAIENSYVHYKCSSVYNKYTEGSINIFDKNLSISLYHEKKDLIMSDRDKNSISFEEYCINPKFFMEKK